MLRFIARLFAPKATAPVRRPPLTFHPRVDMLESREVPALMHWVGGWTDPDNPDPSTATDARVAHNWSPIWVPDDYGGFIPTWRTPVAGDDVLFGGGDIGGNIDCGHFDSDGVEYESVVVLPSYTSTIGLGSDLLTQGLLMKGGAIDQLGCDVMVSGTFNMYGDKALVWTGGVLNSGPLLADVSLLGGNGLIDPGGGILEIGSNLNLKNGAVVEFDGGEIDAHNDPEINLCGNCEADVPLVITSTPMNLKIFGVKQINLTTNDKLDVAGGPMYANCPIYNNNGTLYIHGSGTVDLKSKVDRGSYIQNYSYVQEGNSAALLIESGTTLKAEFGALMTAGKIETRYSYNLPDTVADQKATIDGDLWVSGGLVQICFGGELPEHYGTLYVSGQVNMSGGLYRVWVKGSQAGVCDQWVSGGNFSINPSPSGAGTAALEAVDPDGAATVNNAVWTIIRSDGGTFSGNWASLSLQYDAGPPILAFTYGTSGTPVTKAILTT